MGLTNDKVVGNNETLAGFNAISGMNSEDVLKDMRTQLFGNMVDGDLVLTQSEGESEDSGDEIEDKSSVKVVANNRGKTDANDKMIEMGTAVAGSMKDPDKAISSLSHTLHFVTLLGQGAKKSLRRVGKENVECPSTIGVTLTSDRAIQVPVISVMKNKDTGIEASDIGWRKIAKGKEFHLNMYELMLLITRPEYGGFLSRNGDEQGVLFSPKMAKFAKGEAKLPTPTLTFRYGTGAIKEHMVTVDEKIGDKWEVKPEFKKEFGALYEPKPAKEKEEKIVIPTTTAVSLALGQIFEKAYGSDVTHSS